MVNRSTPPAPPSAEPGGVLERLAAFASARPRLVVALGVALGLVALTLTITRFSMTTDTIKLLSARLPWRVREREFNGLFHTEGDQIVIVVDGATPELADEGAAAITGRLKENPRLFTEVTRPDAGPFFSREGLLFESAADVRRDLDQTIAAQPFLGPLAADPSLRGLMGTLSTALTGVQTGQGSLAQLDKPIGALATSLAALRAGRPAVFSWRELIAGKADRRELRRIVLASPALDYGRLEPGAAPTALIRATARALALDPAHGARVRLTGPVPLQDEEFASLSQHIGWIAAIALTSILAMLYLAVRSSRLIAAILVTMLVGLACAAAWGLLIFHRFNVISVAFIPLFVGLGIDFGIQVSVRYRTEHDSGKDVREALIATSRGMGRSMTLAATAIASGFFSFIPTPYVGLSQLGVIAGAGMFIALALNLTLLPALVTLMAPPRRPLFEDSRRMERLDRFILTRRWWVVGIATGAALTCAAALPRLQFDFNPLHLKNPHSESVTTLADLGRDPETSVDSLEVITPNLPAADALGGRLARLPEVSEVRTLSSYVPTDQGEKLAAIADARNLLSLSLDPIVIAPPPSDQEAVAALKTTASDLRSAAANPGGTNAARLAAELDALAAASPQTRAKASHMLMAPLATVLAQARNVLEAEPVTLAGLPPEIRRDWIAPDGRARVSVMPKGDANDNAVMRRFMNAVRSVAPDATGAPIDTREGALTVERAFIEAGVLSFLAITALLFAVLRKVRDVAITMAPIVLTGLLTLGTCVAIGQPLNFANIIALPLLFGIGVAFHIYFVLAWRSGGTHLLQSSLTRAIFFSALATASGFGSLWASSHPGTASMGKLLMISLLWTLVSALIFQPALMGPPPKE